MKRIEAIRGQILSKLRLFEEPEEKEEEGDEVPTEVLSLYNSTVELSEELTANTVHRTETTEEYYAKEVHKFNMSRSEYI